MRALGSRLAGLTTCALLQGLAGCQEVSAPDPVSDGPAFDAAETVTDVFVEDLEFFDPAPPCTGEGVNWTGTARVVFHQTANRGVPVLPDFIQHRTVNVSVDLTGVGETSGGTYRFKGSVHDIIQSPSPTEPFPTTFRFTFHDRFIGPGGFLGFITFTAKFVLNGNGELVFDRAEFTEECR